MFAQSLKMRRKVLGFSQEALAVKIGITRQSVQKYEAGAMVPGREKWQDLEATLRLPGGWVAEQLGLTATRISAPPMQIRSEMTATVAEPPGMWSSLENRPKPRQVPLISWVQAGGWEYAANPYQTGDADGWIETTAARSPYSFALVVRGDSMEPEFTAGDVIVVDPGRPPEDGSYVIAKNGHEATFKQYVVDGGSTFLKPLNPRYPVKDVTGLQVKVVGVVVEKRKLY